MKRWTLCFALVAMGAGQCLAQDSSLVREPAVATPPPTIFPVVALPAAPMAAIMASAPKPRIYRYAAGFRFSALDKALFFVSGMPHRAVQLELGGFGTRRKSDGRYEYTYRAQAEADFLFLQGNQNRLFAGLRYSWERSRKQYQYYDYYYGVAPAGVPWQETVTSRIGLAVGVDLTAGRFGLQFGLTPLYDQQKTYTQHYQAVTQYYPYVAHDTSATYKENETVMEYTSFFVAVRVQF